MLITPIVSSVFSHFISPLVSSLLDSKDQYRCRVVDDFQWISSGISRVLGEDRSGCAFVQKLLLSGMGCISKGHYFESLKSTRRYRNLLDISSRFTRSQASDALRRNDLFGKGNVANRYLKDFHIYAGDGHFHAAAAHDARDNKDIKNAVGHLYSLNLRNGLLSHLALGSDGTAKKPHDMGVLKKLEVDALRQGAGVGEKVLYIWDRAGINFRQWELWKHQSGIYFISRTKENMKLGSPAPIVYDRKDPLNAGVMADEFVGNSMGTMVRRVTFQVPDTGEVMSFLTNLSHKIAPGIIAQLYFMRWRIEKCFDEIKNKFYEAKAWASGYNAKRMQALFITLSYNLARLFHDKLEQENNLTDHKNQKKRMKRHVELKAKMEGENRHLPRLRETCQKATQLSVKFYRWLRYHLYDPSPWPAAYVRLTRLYKEF
jgi:hypothetical protein